MKELLFVLSFVSLTVAASAVFAQSCEASSNWNNDILDQIICDPTAEYSADDIALLSEYSEFLPVDEVDMSRPARLDAAMYLALAYFDGNGVSVDRERAEALLLDLQNRTNNILFTDRPGGVYFEELGFQSVIYAKLLFQRLEARGVRETDMPFDHIEPPSKGEMEVLEAEARRLIDEGNFDVALEIIRQMNVGFNERLPWGSRPGLELLRRINFRDLRQVAPLLQIYEWSGRTDAGSLGNAARHGDAWARKEFALQLLNGQFVVFRSGSESLPTIDAASALEYLQEHVDALKVEGDQNAWLVALRMMADILADNAADGGDISLSPYVGTFKELVFAGEIDYAMQLFRLTNGRDRSLLNTAAKAGDVEAQMLLAESAEATGQASALVQAAEWYELAAASGRVDAAERLAAILPQVEVYLDAQEAERIAAEEARAAQAAVEAAEREVFADIMRPLLADRNRLREVAKELAVETYVKQFCRNFGAGLGMMFPIEGATETEIRNGVCTGRMMFGEVDFEIINQSIGSCSITGCTITTELACGFRGAFMAEVCSGFYEDGPVVFNGQLVPDPTERRRVRLVELD